MDNSVAQPIEMDREELQAWNNGVSAVQSAIPQLMAIADRTPGYQARFWDAFLSGISGAAAAQVGFAQLRTILHVAQEACDVTEAGIVAGQNKTTTH